MVNHDREAGRAARRSDQAAQRAAYDDVITPMVDHAMRGGGPLRCLIEIEPGFAGLTPPAVADHVVHPEVRAFGYADLPAAQVWAAGSGR